MRMTLYTFMLNDDETEVSTLQRTLTDPLTPKWLVNHLIWCANQGYGCEIVTELTDEEKMYKKVDRVSSAN